MRKSLRVKSNRARFSRKCSFPLDRCSLALGALELSIFLHYLHSEIPPPTRSIVPSFHLATRHAYSSFLLPRPFHPAFHSSILPTTTDDNGAANNEQDTTETENLQSDEWQTSARCPPSDHGLTSKIRKEIAKASVEVVSPPHRWPETACKVWKAWYRLHCSAFYRGTVSEFVESVIPYDVRRVGRTLHTWCMRVFCPCNLKNALRTR